MQNIIKPSQLLSSYGEAEQTIPNTVFRVEIWQDEMASNPLEDEEAFILACKHRNYVLGQDTGLSQLDQYLDDLRSKAFKKRYPYTNFVDDETVPCPHCNQVDSPDNGCNECNDGYIDNPFYIYSGLQEVERITQALEMPLDFDDSVILPLYLFDHSGLSISTTPFSCRWDSGAVGWAFITKESYLELGFETWDKTQAQTLLIQTVTVYDSYLKGENYGFSIYNEDAEDALDACSGYHGDHHKSGLFEALDESFITAYTQWQEVLRNRKQNRFNRIKALIKNRVPLAVRVQELCHN